MSARDHPDQDRAIFWDSGLVARFWGPARGASILSCLHYTKIGAKPVPHVRHQILSPGPPQLLQSETFEPPGLQTDGTRFETRREGVPVGRANRPASRTD